MSESLVILTDLARGKVLELMRAEGQTDMALRFGVAGRGPGGFQYKLGFVSDAEQTADDQVVDAGEGLRVFVDAKSADIVKGTTIDFVDGPEGQGFRIDNPNPLWTDPLSQSIQKVFDDEINPQIAAHGGWVSLLEVKDDVAFIQLGGGCQGCGMADVTLKQGIEVAIRETVPEIREIVDSTDHAGGSNPYYRPSKGGRSPYEA
jgi:Fe/S biogenesis protein NfuA